MTPCVLQLFFQLVFLLTLAHSGAIPPLVKTKGLNEDISMLITFWLYLSFSFHVFVIPENLKSL